MSSNINPIKGLNLLIIIIENIHKISIYLENIHTPPLPRPIEGLLFEAPLPIPLQIPV